MAGGFVYTAVDQTALSTAEIYGKALADIIMKDTKEQADGTGHRVGKAQGFLVFSRCATLPPA